MSINSKSIFLRRVHEAQLLKKLARKQLIILFQFTRSSDSNKRSEADEKADELLKELISESTSKQRR